MITNKVDGFEYTTAIRKLRNMQKRIRGVPGGTSAGKTFGILPILADTAIKKPHSEISVVSETVPHLRKGALKDFLKMMNATNRYIDTNYNRSLLTYTFTNKSYIEFFSADQESKVRGPRRDILYINECNNVSFETYHHLAIRTVDTIWLDFNPSNEFWYHELARDEDFEEVVLTYKDNEALPQSIVKEIEKALIVAFYNPLLTYPDLFNPLNIKNHYWANWWKVYGLGMLGSLEGVVFTNWKQIDEIPRGARLRGYAIDFGYTNDPTTLIALYEYNGKAVWDEMLYQTGMTNGDIAKALKNEGIIRSDFIVADSSEPKSIEEINRHGFRILPAQKGPDSVNFGIDILQQNDFYVTKRSVNMINELRKYMWDKDKTGKTLNRPVDLFNHCIDPMRYLATYKISMRGRKKGLKRRN